MKALFALPVMAVVIGLASVAPASAVTVFSEDFEGYTLGSSPTTGGQPWTTTGTYVQVVENEIIDGVAGGGGIPDISWGQSLGTGVNRLPGAGVPPAPGAGDTSNTSQYLAVARDGGVLSSDIGAAAGFAALTLSFDYGAYRSEGLPGGDTLKVYSVIGGTAQLLTTLGLALLPDPAGHDKGLAWTHLILNIVKDVAATIRLEFNFDFTEHEVGYLDNILVTAVPVPAALPLGAAALGGLGLLGWSRRKRNPAGAIA